MAKNGKPYLPNLEPIVAAGIDPKTGLPIKMGGTPCTIHQDIKHIMRIIDEQDAVNRFVWYNLPDGLNGQMVERMLYYKGQLCFFYLPAMKKFYLMPYALDGNIDFYGRYTGVHPIPFSGGSTNTEKALTKVQADALAAIKLKPKYDVVPLEDWLEDKTIVETSCVLLKDYTEQLSQNIVARQILNDPLISVEAECIPFMRTALMRATGVKGMRVGTQDEQSNVEAANRSMYDAALTGRVNIPIIASVDFQELNDGQVGKAEEFMMALQSLDNFRLSTYGLDNGGLFQKRERKLVAEQEQNAAGGGSVGLVMQDGLTIRQRFCDIVNSIWGLNIAVDISETVSGTDKNLDGELSDQQDQSGMGEGQQPAGGVANE